MANSYLWKVQNQNWKNTWLTSVVNLIESADIWNNIDLLCWIFAIQIIWLKSDKIFAHLYVVLSLYVELVYTDHTYHSCLDMVLTFGLLICITEMFISCTVGSFIRSFIIKISHCNSFAKFHFYYRTKPLKKTCYVVTSRHFIT